MFCFKKCLESGDRHSSLGPFEDVASPTDEFNGAGRIVVSKLRRELQNYEPQLVALLQASKHFAEDVGSTVLNVGAPLGLDPTAGRLLLLASALVV